MFFAAMTVLLCVNAEAADSKEAQAEVKKVLRAWDDAYMKKDVQTLEKILAPEFSAIWDEGKKGDKKMEIEDLKSGKYKCYSTKYKEENVTVVGNVAYSQNLLELDDEYEGKRKTRDIWFMSVLVKKGDAWRIVAAQATVKK